MSKKAIIITIVVVLVLFLVSLTGYYFITQDGSGDGTGKTSGFKDFFPFGGSEPVTPAQIVEGNENGTTQTEAQPENFTKKLRKISSEAVSGAGVLDAKAGTVLRYIEKPTGHIYEVELFSPSKVRISNTTIPLVYDAVWGNKNSSIITRYLKDDNQTIDTRSILVKDLSTSTENTISGIDFPANITDVSSYGSNVFYLEKGDGFSSGFVSNFDGTKKKQVWNSPLKELSSQFVNEKIIALTTRPSEKAMGFMYFVDTTTGQAKNVLANVPGLSALASRDATQVIYLNQVNPLTLFLYDIKTRIPNTLTPTTLPEKCVWSNKDKTIVYCAVPREYLVIGSLTSWYRGFLSFEDDIWKYNLKDKTSNIIIKLSEEAGETIDVIKPTISEGDQYLVFINRNNGSLWSLDLAQ